MVFKGVDAQREAKCPYQKEYDIHDIGEEHDPEQIRY